MQGLSTDETLKTLIYGYKFGNLCKAEMGQFRQARLTPDGGAGNPEAAEAPVSNFLQCVHDVTKFSKANCTTQYQSAYECMRDSVARGGQENACVGALDSFANCCEQ
mmetsp:Transcript_2207/g.2900  ORF Transcript_2207/g.2900 Transcript_2207/m.2900 type:complete len:107 (-) Transcript_2207:119-439(-)|eukprot:CAMPEP_0170458134 /NCGR_PEP_ID=MMETSP0123-20130129/5195_1 /TAXON_ID=182087 /ORGANISM="Favella ehrenbergii, Strain Fehren 1" /LENGTH=106 /DNA_ID=CAMNT_0010722161 /DNA_START=27 /DNA_END=347 /DNA_ORIENTATION=+